MGCCGGDDDKEDTPPPKQISPMKKNVCCTDILFLIIFIAFWAGMVYIAIFGIQNGDVWRLVYGYDSYGNTCNSDKNSEIANVTQSGTDTLNKSNVFFMDALSPTESLEICVLECPSKMLGIPLQVKQFAEDTGSRLCSYEIGLDRYLEEELYKKEGPCPELPLYPSIALLNRCVPDVWSNSSLAEAANSVISFMDLTSLASQVLSDLYKCWVQILILCGIAFVIASLMVIFIRYLASVIVWLIVGLAVVGSVGGTAFLWWTYLEVKDSVDADKAMDIPVLGVDIKNQDAFLAFSITATVLTVILLLLVLVMRKRLQLVVALFHEAGKFLADVPIILVQPIWTFLILMVFFVYWLIIFAYISTSGQPEQSNENGYTGVTYVEDTKLRVFWWYYVVGLIWTSEFILACQQMVISGTVALWYFTRNKRSLSCTVCQATSRLILHHIGTVAFGSFIITLVKIPRLILMYIQRKCSGVDNTFAKCCLKCCICCLYCLEKFLKFLNQNAYTIVAIEGKSFCTAALKAFKIIASNVLRVAAINSVGSFVLFLGKVGVMAATCAISVLWLRDLGLNFYAIPVLFVCIFSFFIAHCFLSIYEMVIDTLLLCFCEDCQMNDGTPQKQYYMNTSLMKFVKNSNQALRTHKMMKKAEKEARRSSSSPEPDYDDDQPSYELDKKKKKY